jgi:lipopolysaccharide biosynthesis regulator YciM
VGQNESKNARNDNALKGVVQDVGKLIQEDDAATRQNTVHHQMNMKKHDESQALLWKIQATLEQNRATLDELSNTLKKILAGQAES